MTQHTKGPWKIDEAEDLPLAIIEDTPDGMGVCEIGAFTPQNIANAHLIAAAPELLEQLEALCAWAEAKNAHPITQEARRVINKTKGQ